MGEGSLLKVVTKQWRGSEEYISGKGGAGGCGSCADACSSAEMRGKGQFLKGESASIPQYQRGFGKTCLWRNVLTPLYGTSSL